MSEGENGGEGNEGECDDEDGDGNGQELNELNCSHWWEESASRRAERWGDDGDEVMSARNWVILS